MTLEDALSYCTQEEREYFNKRGGWVWVEHLAEARKQIETLSAEQKKQETTYIGHDLYKLTLGRLASAINDTLDKARNDLANAQAVNPESPVKKYWNGVAAANKEFISDFEFLLNDCYRLLNDPIVVEAKQEYDTLTQVFDLLYNLHLLREGQKK